MKAAVYTIGDELLLGQILNSNVQWISSKLTEAGIDVKRHLSIGDNKQDIMSALAEGKDLDLIIMTGGLGPTEDDLTAFALAEYFDSPLKFRSELFSRLERIFAKRNIPVTDAHRRQFLLPEMAGILKNALGTAPGLWFSGNPVIISLPGVPHEMRALMITQVLPELEKMRSRENILLKTFCTADADETRIADELRAFEEHLPPGLQVAYLPGIMMVRIRLTGKGVDVRDFASRVQDLEQLLEPWLFGYEEDNLESLIGNLLGKRKQTLATAESCTGGHLAHRITSVPGASEYYLGSVISYDNKVKTGVLGVPKEDILQFGAVSEQVAKAMAIGARNLLKTDYALSTTGVAGPKGGSEEKPVGTVWIGVADKQGAFAKRFLFGKDRQTNIEYSSAAALNALRKVLSAS